MTLLGGNASVYHRFTIQYYKGRFPSFGSVFREYKWNTSTKLGMAGESRERFNVTVPSKAE